MSDRLLRETLGIISHDLSGKPVWWVSASDFNQRPLPSLGGMRASGLTHAFTAQGKRTFERGRQAILEKRLGIPKAKLKEEKAYFFGLPPGVHFMHWKEASNDFLSFALECVSRETGKPIWWLDREDIGACRSPLLGYRPLRGLAYFLTAHNTRGIEQARRDILGKQLGISKPTFEEEKKYFFGLPENVRFMFWQIVSNDFLRFILERVARERGRSIWQLSAKDFFGHSFPSLGGRNAGGIVHLFTLKGSRSFEEGRKEVLGRRLQIKKAV